MKQKFFHAAAVLVIMVLSITLSNQTYAQTSENTGTQPNAVKYSNQAEYMKTPDAGTNMHKTPTGAVKVEENGNVTVFNGITQEVTVVAKPVVDLTVPYGSDFDAYVNNYIQWLKANPDFAKFVSARELAFINEGDYTSLFKSNYLYTQHMAEANK